MEMEKFIQNFAEQFDDIDVSSITKETNYRDLNGWSSMVALSVMAMIDDEYNVQVNATEMRQTNTIQELFDLVSSKLN